MKITVKERLQMPGQTKQTLPIKREASSHLVVRRIAAGDHSCDLGRGERTDSEMSPRLEGCIADSEAVDTKIEKGEFRRKHEKLSFNHSDFGMSVSN